MAKENHVRIVAPNITSEAATVEIDGMDISAQITSLTIDMAAREVNHLAIRYVCTGIEIEGVFRVAHKCPLDEEYGS